MSIKLYWNKVCPFVHRAWIAALEKKVPVELVYVPLGGEMPEWYKQINPRETIPTLQTGNTFIYESNLIAQYLDDAFEPKQSLFPGSAYDRHRIRFFMEQVGGFVGAAYSYLRDPSDEKQTGLKHNIAGLEKLLIEQSEGPFFLGQAFTLADIAIVPFLDRFRHTLFAYCNGFDLFATAPRLKALLDAAYLRPSVFQTAQPGTFYVEAYKSYGTLPETPRPLKLYTAATCPFAERAVLAAALKKVPVEIVEIDLVNPPAWYETDINPRGTVPTLSLGDGKFVHESNLIIAFFDEEFPQSGFSLIPPADAKMRYDINFFLDNLGTFIGAAYMFLSCRGTAERLEDLHKAARSMETLLEQASAGPFFLGEEPCLADVSLIPHLIRFGTALPEYGNGYTTFFAEYPRIGALDAAARAHPVIGSVLKEPDFYLQGMRKFVEGHHL